MHACMQSWLTCSRSRCPCRLGCVLLCAPHRFMRSLAGSCQLGRRVLGCLLHTRQRLSLLRSLQGGQPHTASCAQVSRCQQQVRILFPRMHAPCCFSHGQACATAAACPREQRVRHTLPPTGRAVQTLSDPVCCNSKCSRMLAARLRCAPSQALPKPTCSVEGAPPAEDAAPLLLTGAATGAVGAAASAPCSGAASGGGGDGTRPALSLNWVYLWEGLSSSMPTSSWGTDCST